MTPGELAEIIRSVRELGIVFDVVTAPIDPIDRGAEVRVMAALLGGLVSVDQVSMLRPEHITHPLHRAAYKCIVAGVSPCDWDSLADELGREYPGDLRAWLEVVEVSVPFEGVTAVLDDARRVRELARRRRLARALDELATKLRVGVLDTDQALTELHRIAEPRPTSRRSAAA